MKLPEYISVAEVQRICTEPHIRDWPQLQEAVVPTISNRSIRAVRDAAYFLRENLPPMWAGGWRGHC